MTPDTLQTIIEDAWEDRAAVTAETRGGVRDAVERALDGLDRGEFRVAEKNGGPPVASHHSPFFRVAPEPSIVSGVHAMTVAVIDLLGKN